MEGEIKVPILGESIVEARIAMILKPSGTQVAENEELIELETEKVNQVLYAPSQGIVSWTVNVGDDVKVGDVIGSIIEKAKTEPLPPLPPPPPPPRIEIPKEEKVTTPPPISNGMEVRRNMSKMRKAIAARLVDALKTSAMLTTFNEIDMQAIIETRARYKESFPEKYGVKLGFMSFFVKAVVDALKLLPDLNSYIEGDEIVERHYYDIGIAVGGARGGLVVPVLRGCEHLSFSQIEKGIGELAKNAKEGRLTVDAIQGAGFTITNGGVYGSLLSTPLLNPPQSGILGMHNIVKRAVVIDDKIVIRPMMYVALSYDHRLVDGKEAVTFLTHIKKVLEDPTLLGDLV